MKEVVSKSKVLKTIKNIEDAIRYFILKNKSNGYFWVSEDVIDSVYNEFVNNGYSVKRTNNRLFIRWE
jgi:hypothetical protein